MAKKPKLKIIGEDGNIFNLMGIAKKVAEKNDMDWPEIQKQMMAGNYYNALNVLMDYFDVE